MFKENKYTNLYNMLIERSVERNWKKAPCRERHHIIPQSLCGSNDKTNLVYITPREHFICHWLLIKMTEGDNRSKMLYALMAMRAENNLQHRYKSRVTSRVYEKYRIEHAENHSKLMKSKNLIPWNKGGVEITDKHRKNLIEAALQREPKSKETIDRWKKARAGYKHSDETKLKQSLASTGKLKGPMSEEEKLKRSVKQKGVSKQLGHADNVRAAVLGNISINKDGIEKRIKKDMLQEYLLDGWKLGGKKRITHD